jgi:hypothetical protein
MQKISASGNRRQNAAVQLRLGPLFDPVEDWRRSQPKIPPRSEAIRELVRLALSAPRRDADATS